MNFHEERPHFHKIYIREARKAQGNKIELLQFLTVSRTDVKVFMACQEVKSATKKCLSAGQCCSRSVSYGFWTGGLGRGKFARLPVNKANCSLPAAGKADVEHLSNNVRDVIALFAAPFG